MTLKSLRFCALVLVSCGLFLAAVGCAQCPLLSLDTDGDGMLSDAELLAADPEMLQAQILADPISFLACGDLIDQLSGATGPTTSP